MKYGHCATASIAVLILATTYSSPARADGYDPGPLCASAAPAPADPADLAAALATIRANTVADVTDAGGVAVNLSSAQASVTFSLDSLQRLSRHDSVVGSGARAVATHHVVDGVTGVTYTGHVLGDPNDKQGQLGLKALGAPEGWIAGAPSGAESLTTEAMIDEALAASGFTGLATAAAAAAVTCSVQTPEGGTPQLLLAVGSVKHIITFTPTGALAGLSTAATTGTARTVVFAYPGQTVSLPLALTGAQWKAAVVRGSFAALQNHSLVTARARVKKIPGTAARVAAVRAVAKADAARFFTTARTVSVGNGITVSTARAAGSKSTWSFTLTVVAGKVAIRTNLPDSPPGD